ncbi:MAG: TolC family outer membrane protein [Gammaproteobacteria bacterium]
MSVARKIPPLALLALLSLPGAATAEDLLDICRLAAQSDPQLLAAEAARLATREIRPQRRALRFPAINLTADGSVTRQDLQIPGTGSVNNGVSNFTSSGYALNLVQPLYNHGTSAALRQADALVSQADAVLATAQQELLLRIATRYFDVLAALDSLSFARAEKNAIARQLEQSVQRFDVGLVPVTDVNEAQARYDLAAAQEIAAENQVASAREALREITGSYHEGLAPLADNITFPTPVPNDIEQWADAALKQNTQVNAAEFSAQAARDEIERQRAGHYPSVDLVGTHSFSNSGGGRFGGSQIGSDSLSVQLTAPIFQGGLVNSRTREAQFRFAQSRELLEQQQRTVVRQARASYLNVLANISRADALNQAVKSNQSALDASQAGLDVGIRTSVDVLDAQRLLFQAKRDYARSRYDYIIETLRLKQAAGSLSPVDLEQINKWLNPAASTQASATECSFESGSGAQTSAESYPSSTIPDLNSP